MAVLIGIIGAVAVFFIIFCLYACIVVGSRSEPESYRTYSNDAEQEYIRKCQKVKEERKKRRIFKNKKDKDVIYL